VVDVTERDVGPWWLVLLGLLVLFGGGLLILVGLLVGYMRQWHL
jgi:hypothetical protein